MSIKVRIISADKSKIIEKTLPALPARLKVPEGATVEIYDNETKQLFRLAEYINASAKDAGPGGSDGLASVTVERAESWPEAIAWLDSYDDVAGDDLSNPAIWYNPPERPSRANDDDAEDGDGFDLGLNNDTLLLGGAIGAGLLVGALVLGGGSGGPRDETPPAPPQGLDLAAADDTGSFNDDNLTSQTEGLTFTGTAEAGSEVELFDGTTSLGTTTAAANGTFSFEIDLEEGNHVLTARATDVAGNQSEASQPLTVRIDLTGPEAPSRVDLLAADDTGLSNTDNITQLTTGITLTGTTLPNARVQILDGEQVIATPLASATGTYSVDVDLAPGEHSITARLTDSAGNLGELSDPLVIVVDTTRPLAPTMLDLDGTDDTGQSNTDNITTQTENLTISGNAEAGSRVFIFDGSDVVAVATPDSNGTFVVDIDLDPGTHNIVARTTDRAGNTGPTSDTLQIIVQEAAALVAPDQIFASGADATFG